MYSQPIPKEMADSGNVNRIYINGEELNTFKSIPRESGDIIRNSTDRFIDLRTNHFKDKYFTKFKAITAGKYLPEWVYEKILTIPLVSDEQYADWLKNYLENLLKKPIKHIELYEDFYFYSQSDRPIVYSKCLIFSKKYE